MSKFIDANMNKRAIAVFDFDGTLTSKDTLVEFIKYACGTWRFYLGFTCYSPIIVLMFLHLYPNWKAKEKIFAFFFKGWEYQKFKDYGEEFSLKIENMKKENTMKKLYTHMEKSDTIYVITASILEWVLPWCKKNGINNVLATRIEIDERGIITGRFSSKNCYGQEKVNRLLQVEPHRHTYTLYAYGDSRGDKEMIEFSDFGTYC